MPSIAMSRQPQSSGRAIATRLTQERVHKVADVEASSWIPAQS